MYQQNWNVWIEVGHVNGKKHVGCATDCWHKKKKEYCGWRFFNIDKSWKRLKRFQQKTEEIIYIIIMFFFEKSFEFGIKYNINDLLLSYGEVIATFLKKR